jgi:uncharacterized RDD family membrane protein YckC/uncharacterized protein YbaR (Trm112 family)
MNWHYVNQGQQAGPVTEEELLALVREGKISEETLVWREGMQNWTPFHEAGLPTAPPPAQPPPFQPPAPVNPNEAVCAECGKIYPIDETISYGNMRVCAACKPVFLQKLAEGAKIKPAAGDMDLNYAGFWIRFCAKFIDGLILGVPFMIVVFLVIGLSGGFSETPGQRHYPANDRAPFMMLFLQLGLQFGIIALQIAYQTFFVGKYGATPGKMACGLKIVMPDGSRVSYGRAAGRAFGELLSAWTCYIGYLIIVFDSQKRALHDHMCSTRVVRK